MFRSGQHFLTNQPVLKKIAEALDVEKDDVVIEIGAGHGELADELRIMNNELRIIAVEKDRELVNVLREKFTHDKNMEIVEGDVLKILPSLVENCKLKIENYKLIGNIPYYITGKLLRTISELEQKPTQCVFMLQKEVVERLVGSPPHTTRLSASVQFWAKPEIIGYVPKSDFKPKPEVDSAIVKLVSGVRYPAFVKTSAGKQVSRSITPERYYRAVRVLFQQPRKTILNNLVGGTKTKKEMLIKKLSEIGIDPTSRPQNLSIEDIVRIARFLSAASVSDSL